jgi:hypothetical protein
LILEIGCYLHQDKARGGHFTAVLGPHALL